MMPAVGEAADATSLLQRCFRLLFPLYAGRRDVTLPSARLPTPTTHKRLELRRKRLGGGTYVSGASSILYKFQSV
jgi:hypothetical protein